MESTGGALNGSRRRVARLLGGPSELPTGTVLRFSLVAGVLGGIGEAVYLTARTAIKGLLPYGYFPEMLWMAPIAGALTFVLLATGLLIVAAWARTGIGAGQATLVFAFLAVFGVVQSPGIPIHVLAKAILSAGAAAVMARFAARRAATLRLWIRRATPLAGAALLLFLVWGMATLPDTAERRTLRGLPAARAGMPNVVLVILDTVRAANLGLYGYARATSPAIDAWAADGVVFERAVTTAPWTLPSHASMFTGQYNHVLGTGFHRPLDDKHTTLAEVLAGHGYATAAFVANLSFATRTSGLHRGFARYEDFYVTPGMFLHTYWVPRGFARIAARVPQLPRWQKKKNAEQVNTAFRRWFERRPERPFFVFLNYFDAHDPYEPPPPYRSRFGPAPDHELDDQKEYTTEELAPWINAYDGAIAYIGDQLEELFALLAQQGVGDNTLVVLTSDHGEMFGERGQVQHTNGVYMPSLHVPLVMVYPTGIPSGVRVREAVTLRDLPATILEVIGISADARIGGRSFVARWSTDGGAADGSALLAEIDFIQDGITQFDPDADGHLKSLVEGWMQYIRFGGGVEELYDLESDPVLDRNLADAAEMRPVLERFRTLLDSLLVRRP